MKKTFTVCALLLAACLSLPASFAETVEPKPAADASPVLVIDTPSFLKTAIAANQFEIDSSTLAKDKSQDPAIQVAADLIIQDHTKAGAKLEALLKDDPNKPASLPSLSPKEQKMMSQLQAASGNDFETLYVDIQFQAHKEAVALFKTYAATGDDEAIMGFARETLPRLEMHLHHVKELVTSQ
jgi:putative membrane protein